MSLLRSSAKANDVRVPAPQRGTAVVIQRYRSEKAVILHPSDFAELEQLATALDEISKPAASELSDLELRAHQLEESPEGELVEDEESLREILDL